MRVCWEDLQTLMDILINLFHSEFIMGYENNQVTYGCT